MDTGYVDVILGSEIDEPSIWLGPTKVRQEVTEPASMNKMP
jgi:hypothetical protein